MYAIDRASLIAWRSAGGLRNEGRVTFRPVPQRPRSDAGTKERWTDVTLAIRVDVPGMVASLFDLGFVKTFVDDTLAADLVRLRTVALRLRRQRIARGDTEVPTKAAAAVENAIAKLRAQEAREEEAEEEGTVQQQEVSGA